MGIVPKNKAVRITLISAIVSLVSFGYKLSLGIITTSMVLIIASISTLMVFVCKLMFVRNYTQDRERKKKGYLVMIIAAIVYSLIFILFVVLKVSGIDVSRQNNYEGWVEIIFIVFILLMFVLSILNLRKSLVKSEIMSIGLKEMTFISALTDVVIINEFIVRVIVRYIPRLSQPLWFVSSYVPLGIGVLMVVVSVHMIKRYISYDAKK